MPRTTIEESSLVASSGIQALERAVRLLELLSTSKPQTMQSLSDALGCSPSTVHRIVVTLTRGELLQFDPVTHRYGLGIGITRLAQRRAAKFDLVSVAQSHMDELRAVTRETVSLWVRSNDAKVCVAVSEGSQEIRQYVAVGAMAPLELSAGSRVLMAEEDAETITNWVRGSLGGIDLLTESRVANDVISIKLNGIVMLSDESGNRHHPDVATMAAPIFGEGNSVVAALVIAGPTPRFTLDRMMDAREPIRARARAISLALGSDPSGALD